MSNSQPIYQSKIYLEFLEIAPNEYRAIVDFVEDNLEILKEIPFNEYFDLFDSYLNALFEIGHYRSYLIRVDIAIEASILKNIKEHNGENVYEKLLFRKAAANYNLMEYEKAEYIIEELIKINPLDKTYSAFLKRARSKNVPEYVFFGRTASIFLFFLSAFIIALEILFVKYFYEAYEPHVRVARNVVFILGWVALLSGEAFHRYRTHKKVDKFVEQTRRKKHITKIVEKEWC